jgi:hypothetical protein
MAYEQPHNLNLQNYTLEELFGLFDIRVGRIGPNDIKLAKRKVLMLHPDKSHLAPDYFLFYKKALDIIVKYCEDDERQKKEVGNEAIDYKPTNTLNKSSQNAVQKNIEKMSAKDFHGKFNQLFEEHMVEKPDTRRNEWFTNDKPDYEVAKNVSVGNMGAAIDEIKRNNPSSAIVTHTGLQTIGSTIGTNLYGDLEDDANDIGNAHYLSSDPFSKLKYDDLRKVHKDQTVLPVSERDYHKIPKYSSVDHFVRERNVNDVKPLAETQAALLLEQAEKARKDALLKKEHAATMRTMKYEEQNKSILSRFLQLGN